MKLHVNSIVEAKVIRETDYGLYLEKDGRQILVPLPEIGWGRVTHPTEGGRNGDIVQVKILMNDEKREYAVGSFKEVDPSSDPWLNLGFEVGDKLIGEVVSILDYGFFIMIKKGVEGLVETMKETKVKPMLGEQIEVIVMKIQMQERRVDFKRA